MADSNKYVDFSDTQTAFASKSAKELTKSLWLFRLMSNSTLVDIATKLGGWAVRWNFPLAKMLVKKTIFDQFVGGESLTESQSSIEKLWKSRILSVLDYGAEGKTTEKDLDDARDQFIRSALFAAASESVPVVSIKVSALAQNELLEEVQRGGKLTSEAQQRYARVKERVNQICQEAYEQGIKIFIDAEETWIQEPIDRLVEDMMQQYNKDGVVVYQTFQMYRKDRYGYLIQLYESAKTKGHKLGAKLVRGAYMEKERDRAEEEQYPSPIHETKAEVDADFDRAILFCIDHYEEIASCAATHNMQSCLYQAELIGKRNLPRNHPHLNFCQLYGMSDHITFNLAANGYNVAKYVVYGKVAEVVPYLSRRAAENTATQGEFGREYQLLLTESNRRKGKR
ncbi:MAG: proline dehydrogenase family protein [Saprospiraceae bacterium]|nr:proline dehydrogenase family protein [Saprospiraceae bacterium]